ncbi:MAG: DinB family protein [Caldilineaceae bacterium]
MNADAFRHLYAYHFSENRALWNRYIAPLAQAEFTQAAGYSHGSVRDQLVHLIDVDEIWFCELQTIEPSPPLSSADQDDRQRLRAHWDGIEQMMQRYLATLQDGMLFTKPIQEPDEDRDLLVWQVLLHVVNHGTDHRAQLLRQLNDLGVETVSQDYIFYVYNHPNNGENHDKV